MVVFKWRRILQDACENLSSAILLPFGGSCVEVMLTHHRIWRVLLFPRKHDLIFLKSCCIFFLKKQKTTCFLQRMKNIWKPYFLKEFSIFFLTFAHGFFSTHFIRNSRMLQATQTWKDTIVNGNLICNTLNKCTLIKLN